MRTAISLSAVLAVVAIGACSDNNLDAGKKPGNDTIDFGNGSGTETCGNGLDDDKNGLIDEGCVCEPGSTQICCATGSQKGGTQTCYLQNTKENAIGSWGPCEGAQGGDCYGGDNNTGSGSGDNNTGSGSGDNNTGSSGTPGSGSGDNNTGTPGSGSGDNNTGTPGSGSGDNNTSGAGAGSGTGDFNTGSGANSGTGDFNSTSGAGAGSGTGDFDTGSGSGDFLTSGAGPGSGSGDNNTSGAGAGSGSGPGSGSGDNNTSGAGAGSSSSGGGDECVCAPGTWRWCDTPEACLWGVQVCAPDFSWGKCNESNNAPSGCQPGVYDMGCCLNHPAACCENPFNHQSMGECTQQLDCN